MNRALGKGVLYHAVSSYQLLEAMLHRRLFHREERATLLLPDFIVGKYPQWQRLEGPFFDRVALFPYLLIPHGEEGRVLADTAAAWQSLGLPPAESFFKRYVMGAHFYFSLYLEAKGLPFSFFEDAAGTLSRPDQAAAILGRKFPQHAELARRHGLFSGENPLIREVFCCLEAQARFPQLPVPVWDFSVERALEALPPWERWRLVRFFVPQPLRCRGEALLLTQQFSALGMLTEEEQRELYRSLAEGLLRGVPLLIKKHPDDPLDYGEVFPGARTIGTVFPAELLPYVFRGKRPQRVYAFDSASLANLGEHFETVGLGSVEVPAPKGKPVGKEELHA